MGVPIHMSGTWNVAQAGLEFLIFLLQLPRCWDKRLSPAQILLINVETPLPQRNQAYIVSQVWVTYPDWHVLGLQNIKEFSQSPDKKKKEKPRVNTLPVCDWSPTSFSNNRKSLWQDSDVILGAGRWYLLGPSLQCSRPWVQYLHYKTKQQTPDVISWHP